METFEIGKIRVNRVLTVRSLMQKIAAHYEIREVKDLTVRFGDLGLVFDANSKDSDLDKRLFQDLDFTEANMIGVQLHNSSRNILLKKKFEKQVA